MSNVGLFWLTLFTRVRTKAVVTEVQQQLIVGGEEEGIGRHGRASESAPDSLPGQWPVGMCGEEGDEQDE
jgi:hypothetical protein